MCRYDITQGQGLKGTGKFSIKPSKKQQRWTGDEVAIWSWTTAEESSYLFIYLVSRNRCGDSQKLSGNSNLSAGPSSSMVIVCSSINSTIAKNKDTCKISEHLTWFQRMITARLDKLTTRQFRDAIKSMCKLISRKKHAHGQERITIKRCLYFDTTVSIAKTHSFL